MNKKLFSFFPSLVSLSIERFCPAVRLLQIIRNSPVPTRTINKLIISKCSSPPAYEFINIEEIGVGISPSFLVSCCPPGGKRIVPLLHPPFISGYCFCFCLLLQPYACQLEIPSIQQEPELLLYPIRDHLAIASCGLFYFYHK